MRYGIWYDICSIENTLTISVVTAASPFFCTSICSRLVDVHFSLGWIPACEVEKKQFDVELKCLVGITLSSELKMTPCLASGKDQTPPTPGCPFAWTSHFVTPRFCHFLGQGSSSMILQLMKVVFGRGSLDNPLTLSSASMSFGCPPYKIFTRIVDFDIRRPSHPRKSLDRFAPNVGGAVGFVWPRCHFAGEACFPFGSALYRVIFIFSSDSVCNDLSTFCIDGLDIDYE